MDFIEAIIKIHEKGWNICGDSGERNGTRPSVCIHDEHGIFRGKLRWPQAKCHPIDEPEPAYIDKELEEALT